MNPAVTIALIALLKEATILYLDLLQKTEITKEDLIAKTPEQIYAELGIDILEPKKDDTE